MVSLKFTTPPLRILGGQLNPVDRCRMNKSLAIVINERPPLGMLGLGINAKTPWRDDANTISTFFVNDLKTEISAVVQEQKIGWKTLASLRYFGDSLINKEKTSQINWWYYNLNKWRTAKAPRQTQRQWHLHILGGKSLGLNCTAWAGARQPNKLLNQKQMIPFQGRPLSMSPCVFHSAKINNPISKWSL